MATKPAKKKEAKKKPTKKKAAKKKIAKKKTKKKTAKKRAPTKTSFKTGNQYWQLRNKHGRNKAYESPDSLWEACCNYFIWIDQNYLKEEKVFVHQGKVTRTHVKKLRAMTLRGLYLHLGISNDTWANYKQTADFLDIITMVEDVIFEQKLTGAAADLFNANIISRELGLAEKKEISTAVSMVMDKQDLDA